MGWLKKLDFKTLLILGLFIVIVLMKVFEKKPTTKGDTVKINGKKYEVVSHEIDTIETVHDSIVFKKGKDIYHDTTIYVPIPTHEPIDTQSLLLEYFAKNVYKDSLNFPNQLGSVSITDTISKNTILSRKWDLHLIERKIEDKLIVKELPKNQIYFGMVAGFDKVNVVNFAGPSMVLKTKKDNMYSIGVGYNNVKTVSLQGGIYWKIKLKK
jgi:hypothetical protein